MRARHCRWPLGFVFFLGACGGGGPTLDVSFSLRALSVTPSGLRVEAWDMRPACRQVRLSFESRPGGPSPLKALTFDLGSEDALYELPDLEENPAYTIAAWALDEDNDRVGFGCQTDVAVRDGEATEIEISLTDFE